MCTGMFHTLWASWNIVFLEMNMAGISAIMGRAENSVVEYGSSNTMMGKDSLMVDRIPAQSGLFSQAIRFLDTIKTAQVGLLPRRLSTNKCGKRKRLSAITFIIITIYQ